MQASAATFSDTPLGHAFCLRTPLAKATANKCKICAEDIRLHSRHEVTDAQLLAVLNAQDDGKATAIIPNELAVGSYKAALAACKDPSAAVLNCAGTGLHAFLPATKKPFDALRTETPPRLYDLEWEDSEEFALQLDDIVAALAWAREQRAAGKHLVVNCAQGKSRSGTMCVAYLCAKLKLPVKEALARAQQKRPLIQPNPTFIRALDTFEAALLTLPSPVSPGEAKLRAAHAQHDADQTGGLTVAQLQALLVASGNPANAAKRLVEEHGRDGEAEGRRELAVEAFIAAWSAEGFADP